MQKRKMAVWGQKAFIFPPSCAPSVGHVGPGVWGWQLQKARPDLPAVSLWNFFDGYSHLIAQISASVHDSIRVTPAAV